MRRRLDEACDEDEMLERAKRVKRENREEGEDGVGSSLLGLDYASEEPEDMPEEEKEEEKQGGPSSKDLDADALLDDFMASLESSGLLVDHVDNGIPPAPVTEASPGPAAAVVLLPSEDKVKVQKVRPETGPSVHVTVRAAQPSALKPSAAVEDMLRTAVKEANEAAGELMSSPLPLAVRIAIEAEIRLKDWLDLSQSTGQGEKGLDWASYSDFVSKSVMGCLSELPRAKKEAARVVREQRLRYGPMAGASVVLEGPLIPQTIPGSIKCYSEFHHAPLHHYQQYSYPIQMGLMMEEEDPPPLPPEPEDSPPPPPPPPTPPLSPSPSSSRFGSTGFGSTGSSCSRFRSSREDGCCFRQESKAWKTLRRPWYA